MGPGGVQITAADAAVFDFNVDIPGLEWLRGEFVQFEVGPVFGYCTPSADSADPGGGMFSLPSNAA